MQKTNTEVANAIRGTIGIGPGYITNFALNGKIEHKKITWKRYCVVDVLYGGVICDNKMIIRIKKGDEWSIGDMTVKGTVINSVDATMIDNVEEVKRKTAKRKKVINY